MWTKDDDDEETDTHRARRSRHFSFEIRSLELDHVVQSVWMEKSRHDDDWNGKYKKTEKSWGKNDSNPTRTVTIYVQRPATALSIAHTHTLTRAFLCFCCSSRAASSENDSHVEVKCGLWRVGPISQYHTHTHATRLSECCLHRTLSLPPYPLKRKCQKLFWCILFDAVDFTLFLDIFVALSIAFIFVYDVWWLCLVCEHCVYESVRLLEPQNFMEWTTARLLLLFDERFPAPNGNRFTFRRLLF